MKKIISLILVTVMCLCTVPSVLAKRDVSYEETLAQDLKNLGIFKGVSDTEFDLGRAPTRVEALVMLIRLLGKESTANSGNWSHPFDDVPGWADDYVGYAYESGLTNGVSKTEFGTGNANIQMFLTFVLRSLDYSDKGNADFSYSDPFSLAKQTGILPDSVNQKDFLRADVVLVSYAALSSYMKNTSKTLASELIEDRVFTASAFSKYYDKDALKNHVVSQGKELTAEQIFAQCSPAVFYVEVYDAYGQATGSGSGFFINSDGTAVTNYHVIDGAHSAKVLIGDTEEVYDVSFVYDYSEAEDWAVIQIDGTGFDYLETGDASSVVGGASVYAIGSPLGLQNTISQGIISNANRVVDGLSFIQTSAAISSGSSGGALINKYGKVIGITSAKFSEGENLGLALPISVIDKCDYSNHRTLSQIAGGGYSSIDNSEYTAEEVLAAYVLVYKNEDINEKIAYTETVDTENGYMDASVVLDSDGNLSVLLWEVYQGDTYYFSFDINNPNRFLYYDYESETGRTKFIGSSWINPASVTRGMPVVFQDVEGNAERELNQDIASEYLEIGLDFLNALFENIASVEGFDLYTVADLGFVNFR